MARRALICNSSPSEALPQTTKAVLLDPELFETLTLIQTGKVRPVPVVLFGRAYWERVIDLDALVDEGTIDPKDRDLIRFAERAEDAWALIREFYAEADQVDAIATDA